MKNVNELVLTVQAEGKESYAYVELFDVISSETINPKTASFRLQLKGQIEEAISEGYALLMELVNSWDGTGNFHSLYKTSFNNRLLNLVKYMKREKRTQDVNYSVSLSETAKAESGESSPMLEVATDDKLQTSVDFLKFESEPTIESMIAKFGENNPEQAGVIELMTNFSDDMKQVEKSKAFCVYFGVQTYTEIQKKVSRSREAFYKFLKQNDFQLAF